MSRAIPPQLRRQVWETYMKNPKLAYGPCFVCENEIHILQFECGHVKSHRDGGEIKAYNLRPICGSCNKSMGTDNLLEYKRTFFDSRGLDNRGRLDDRGRSGNKSRSKPKSKPKPTSKSGSKPKSKPKPSSKSGDSLLDQMISGFSNLVIGDHSGNCKWILKKGPRKGELCDKTGNHSGYCSSHHKLVNK